jgi:hypothetical protein
LFIKDQPVFERSKWAIFWQFRRLQTASETLRQWSFLACSLTSGNKLSVGQGIFDLGNNQFGGNFGLSGPIVDRHIRRPEGK